MSHKLDVMFATVARHVRIGEARQLLGLNQTAPGSAETVGSEGYPGVNAWRFVSGPDLISCCAVLAPARLSLFMSRAFSKGAMLRSPDICGFASVQAEFSSCHKSRGEWPMKSCFRNCAGSSCLGSGEMGIADWWTFTSLL